MLKTRNWRKTYRIGQIFADMRKANEKSIHEVSKVLKCSPQNIQYFETGSNDSMYIAMYYIVNFNDGVIPSSLICMDGDYLCRE